MRPATVSMIKGRNSNPLQKVPKEGTRTRKYYDLLITGEPVWFESNEIKSNIKNYLELFYNMDFINLGSGYLQLRG